MGNLCTHPSCGLFVGTWVETSAFFARVLLDARCRVSLTLDSQGTCLVCVVEGREAKRSMGVFSLAGDWTSPMAFVTTTLALVVHSPICMRAW